MGDPLVRLVVVVVVVAVATLLGRWWRARDGHLREVAAPSAPRMAADELTALGFDLDAHRTIALLLSSPTCGTCVPVRRLLDELALTRHDLSWTDVDVTGRPELAERFGILRLPTTLLFEPDGHLVARASGVPPRDEIVSHLDRHVHAGTH